MGLRTCGWGPRPPEEERTLSEHQSVKERSSFWTTVPGLITGLAGILTAIVGLITVSMQAGWLRSSSKTKTTTAATAPSTTIAGSPGTTSQSSATLPLLGGGSATSSPVTTSPSHLSVTPAQLTFQAIGNAPQTVTVQNGGSTTVTFTAPPSVAGIDASQFTISKTTCTTSLAAGRSCDVQVTYLATKAAQSARLVISPASAPSIEVPLSGTIL